MNQEFPEIHEFKQSFDEAIEAHQKLGQNYARAKALSWRMQELTKALLASWASGYTGSEASKERQAKASEEYMTHIDGTAQAIREEIQAKVEFDAANKEFEKLRSLCSLEKKQIGLV